MTTNFAVGATCRVRMGADAKALRIAALSLVYFIPEYSALVWCSSAHTRLIDSVLDDALSIVTGCLHPTPTYYLPILARNQPAELRRQRATLSLAYRSLMDPKHLLHQLIVGKTTVHEKRLRS